jgi:hypothetical protein
MKNELEQRVRLGRLDPIMLKELKKSLEPLNKVVADKVCSYTECFKDNSDGFFVSNMDLPLDRNEKCL